MTLIQAITMAQKLTQQTGRQHIVLEEQFQAHKPSYHVRDGWMWDRTVQNNPTYTDRFKQVYPPVTP